MASLAIGPLNVAGQAYQWSESAARGLGISAWSFSGSVGRTRAMDGPAHHRIPHHRLRPRSVRGTWLRTLLRNRTHLLVESMHPLFGSPRETPLFDATDYVRERGITLGAVFHGTDLRDSVRHMTRLKHSYYSLWDEQRRKALDELAARRRAEVTRLGIPSFVSTPDMLLDLPNAAWLPLVVDPRQWRSDRGVLRGRRPVVLHVPSGRRPPIKGTDVIDEVLGELDREGAVEYRSPATTVPHEKMPELLREADIVVEQILSGYYSLTAVEAMAAGCLVVGYVGDEVRGLMPEQPPIVDATPDDLLPVMMEIIGNRDDYAGLAAGGPGYVERTHSGRRSAEVLSTFLGT